MNVDAIWLRRIGDRVQVLFESQDGWRQIIDEEIDDSFSYIAEHPALEAAPIDPVSVTDNPYRRNGREWVTPK